ncbi:glycolate oxidase subunit GlcE [Steroidobacter sp.]|uniref:glycolate oxidase subunit GlcE n=1 Tax=Steroidobacter sp. TaxID=1978227 RepID=UPI001A4D5943|nr:glycolate oxidase subunit GlcE [Steroidobacter sp.]MBL8270829.1 glycolate oxidase subunit GlcE [Steroidobacter sp.]
MDPALRQICETVRAASASQTPLRIRAGGTKDFYGNEPLGTLLDPRSVAGVVDYEPTELVVTARAGTSLAELEQLLTENGQMLAFEPPHFGVGATVGGCIASGLAGPRRVSFGPTYGGVRDFVLGTKLVDGRGEVLSFGGTVMKNVAGYDVSRVLAGSLGILGVIVEVSLKVLPRPMSHHTLSFEMSETAAVDKLNEWAGQPLPLSASAWHDGVLYLRLAGAPAAVTAARRQLGGEAIDNAQADVFWTSIREQTHPFFTAPPNEHSRAAGNATGRAGTATENLNAAGSGLALWRISVPSTAPALSIHGPQLIEWNGSLRWLRTDQAAASVRECAKQTGGHATLFRGGDRTAGVFTPLSASLATIHQRLKAQFDPAGIFNPGRLYPNL